LDRETVLPRKRYADTLEIIAERGSDAFYTGRIAETMIDTLQRANGTMTLEDLRNYTDAIRTPAQIEYRGYKVTSCSAPSSGEVALAALKTVEGYSDFFAPSNVQFSTHRLDEAIRFTYGQRSVLGDPLSVFGVDDFQRAML
jgi:gamma-glutamyltranspeptidase / glutathione hydrolase